MESKAVFFFSWLKWILHFSKVLMNHHDGIDAEVAAELAYPKCQLRGGPKKSHREQAKTWAVKGGQAWIDTIFKFHINGLGHGSFGFKSPEKRI